MINFRTMYAILDHITLAQTITECVLVCDYSCAYFKVFKAMKSSDIHQQALLYYDKTLVVLDYAYAKIYRNVVVDEKMGFFRKKGAKFT